MRQLLQLHEPLDSIRNPVDLFNKIKKINVNYKQENFIIFVLNTKSQVVHSEVLFKGGIDFCPVDVKTVFRVALEHNGHHLIFAHNHPSGCLIPSQDDKNVLKYLKDAGKIMDIKVLDFLVFNENEYYNISSGIQ